MSSYRLTQQAQSDLTDLSLFIAHDNSSAAIRIIQQIRKQCRLLADSPGIGRLRPELGSDVKSIPIRHYIIFYRPDEQGVVILRILHAARDIPPLFT